MDKIKYPKIKDVIFPHSVRNASLGSKIRRPPTCIPSRMQPEYCHMVAFLRNEMKGKAGHIFTERESRWDSLPAILNSETKFGKANLSTKSNTHDKEVILHAFLSQL